MKSTQLNNKTIFLTGATGFVGKAVLEKLLRCFNCKRIYLLIRGDASTKAETLRKSTVFDRLRSELEGTAFDELFLSKVVPIQGDHEKVDVGLSDAQRRQIQDTDLIIHSAASVSFNLPFVEALSVNLLGTMRILELARMMYNTNPNFSGMEYISTAFVNANYSNVPGGHPYVIKEDLYSFSVMKEGKEYKVDKLVDIVQESLPRLLRNERPSDIIMEYANVFTNHQWANTYTLTKHMTEKLLIKMREKVPVAILRPAVIAASVEEPEPGWTESPAGIHAIMISMALGYVTQFPFVRNAAVDTVPVDYCAAAILEVGCYFVKNDKHHKEKGTGEFYRDVKMRDAHLPLVPIFHLSSGCNPIQWSDIVGGLESYFNVSPLKRSISSKISVKTTSEVENLTKHIATLVEQHKQAQDPIEKKKLAAEISITQKFHFFMTNSYQFESENLGEVRQDLQWALWNHNFSELDWHNYVKRVCYGLQKGVFKELVPTSVKL